MYKILRRSLAFLLSFMLCFQLFPALTQASQNAMKDVTAVDFTKRSVAKKAGLAVSSLHKKSGDFTTALSGKSLENNFSVSARKDWSGHSAIQMWVYSPKGEITPVSFALISENPKTVGRDFYYVTAYIGALGWNSVYIPYNGEGSQVYAKGTPLGLDNISGVEILTDFDGEEASTSAEIYLDKMILTNSPANYFSAGSYSAVGSNQAVSAGGEKDDNSLFKVYDGFVLAQSSVHLGLPTITDWTGYNTLVIRATNENKTERAYDVNVYSENPDTNGPDYYQFYIQADWEGTKEFSFDIRNGGGFHKSRMPLGWNQITGIIISTGKSPLQTEMGTVENDQTHIRVEGVYLTNRDYDYLFTDDTEDYLIDAKLEYINGSKEYKDYASEIHKRTPNHPRILIDAEYLESLKELVKTDTYVNKTVARIKSDVDQYVKDGPITKPDSSEPPKMSSAALLYNVIPDQKYADYVWQSMLNITKYANNWNNDNHSSLSHGDTMRAVAYTYDWMYNHWTESQRRIVRNAMMHFGLKLSLSYLRPYKSWWGGQGGNWCQIILSGTCLLALAMCDDPKYDNLVNEVVNRCVVGLSFTHDRTISADGSYIEGAAYWSYGMGNYIPFLAAFYETTGSNELMELPGMDRTGMFPIGMTGPKGFYNFGDGTNGAAVTAGGYFFLSRYFDDPSYGSYQIQYTQSGGDYRALALYRPDERYKEFTKYMPNYIHFPGENDVLTIRRSWTDDNAAFLGVKAGTNGASSHGNLDIGSFVFDLMGVRWADELGRDTYDGAYLYKDGKYAFYRNRAEGQNALVINPDGSIDQNTKASCKIGDYKANANGAYITMDITEAYEGKGVDSVMRGFAMLNNYGALLVQDEIVSSSPVESYSFIHTKANIEVSEDGRSAVLTQDGQKLRARIISPSEGRFISMEADPLPLSPNPEEAFPRSGYRKLALHIENVLNPTISMILTPYQEDESAEFSVDAVIPIRQFKNYLKNPVKVNGIYIDGVPIQNFDSSVSTYVLSNEFEVGTVTATAPDGVKVSVTQAEKIGDCAYVIAESERNKNRAVYTLSFADNLQKMMDISSYTPEKLIASVRPESAGKIIDGDSVSDWSISMSGWVGMDFGKPRELREMQVIWYKGSERTAYFDIDVSDDGENWRTVLSSESYRQDSFETYKFEPVKARYIRIYGKGNSSNTYVSICEVRVTAFDDKFTDMADHWAKKDVENLANLGLIQGLPDESFNPEGAITRAEFAALIQKVTGISPMPYSGAFKDVIAGENSDIIEGLYATGLIPSEMISDGAFYPNKEITCEEAMSMCVIATNKLGNMLPYYASLDDYEYAESISGNYLAYMKNARALKLLSSSLMKTGFNPLSNITRAQAAVLAKRVYVKLF